MVTLVASRAGPFLKNGRDQKVYTESSSHGLDFCLMAASFDILLAIEVTAGR